MPSAFDVLFLVFGALTLGCAAALILVRNPVHSAFLMIVSFLGLAGLLFLLEAYFLAVLQILVYAGAVVVLFLFIIMLLGVEDGPPVRLKSVANAAALLMVPLLALGVWSVVGAEAFADRPYSETTAVSAGLRGFGQALFTRYLLPLQVAGFLLLVAMVGVIVLSKKLPVPGEDAVKR